MVNPYEAPSARSSPTEQRRRVASYAAASALLVIVGFVTAIPGLILLNQEWQLIPTDSAFYVIEFNGRPITNETIILRTIGIWFASSFVALLLGIKSYLNRRHNHDRGTATSGS